MNRHPHGDLFARFDTRLLSIVLPLVIAFGLPPTGASAPLVTFVDFAIVEPGGRPAHEGLFRLQGAPIAGSTVEARARLSGPHRVVAFHLFDDSGALVASPDFASHENLDVGSYYGRFVVPSERFRIAAEVTDHDGRVVWVSPTVGEWTRPRTIDLRLTPTAGILVPGTTAVVMATVTNHGAEGDFDLVIGDNAGVRVLPVHSVMHLRQGESAALDLRVALEPGDVDEIGSYTLTGKVASQADIFNSNHAEESIQVHTAVGVPIEVGHRSDCGVSRLTRSAGGPVVLVIFGDPRIDVTQIAAESLRVAGAVWPRSVSVRDVGPPGHGLCDDSIPDGRNDLVIVLADGEVLTVLEDRRQAAGSRGRIPVSVEGSFKSGVPLYGTALLPLSAAPSAPRKNGAQPSNSRSLAPR